MNEWTEQELAKLRELAGTKCGREIAPLIGRTKWAVLRKMHELKIKGYAPGSPHGWTEEQFEMLRNVKPGISSIEFAKRIGKSDEAVRHWARKFGTKFVAARIWTEKDIAALRSMEGRLNLTQAAAELGRTERAIRSKAEELGVKLAWKQRPRKERPQRREHTKRPHPVAVQHSHRIPARKLPTRSSIEWCPRCFSPVSNWSEHFERMGHRRPAA